MALALWIVGAWVALVFFGTWALQIVVWLAQAVLLVVKLIVVGLLAVAGVVALFFMDRKQLTGIFRDEGLRGRTPSPVTRDRWV